MTVNQAGIKGLARVEQVYANRAGRARELRNQGKKIMGHFCCYAPPELLTAAGLVPFRILGNAEEPISKADDHLETIVCPYVRSCFDIALKGAYDFLDGFVCPHTCDNVTAIYEIWQYYLNPPYSHFLNVPHTLSKPSMALFEVELRAYKRSLERLAGAEVTEDQIETAIELHNQTRALVKELYELRKLDPPLLSGSDVMKTMVAVMSLPADEANDLLREVILDVKALPSTLGRAPRILLYGAEIDHPAFLEIVEECGANIVADDLCVGSRPYRNSVESQGDYIANLARYYLHEITCPRTYRTAIEGWEQDLELRFGYLRSMAEEYKVDGVIYYDMRYCDIFGFQAPDVKDYLEKAGFDVLYLENDYFRANTPRLRTRVEAFLEMIAEKKASA